MNHLGRVVARIAPILSGNRGGNGESPERFFHTTGVIAAIAQQGAALASHDCGRRDRYALVAEGVLSWCGASRPGSEQIGPRLGRGFTADDRIGRAPVVVINAEAATRFFPDREPLGQRVRLPQVVPGEPEVAEIVGVVGNVVYWPADEPPGPDVYQPALQFSYPWTTVMVRTARDPLAALPALRRAVRELSTE